MITCCELNYATYFWVTLLNLTCLAMVALLKQQGVGLKGLAKSAPVNEEVPPLLEGGGKMEV